MRRVFEVLALDGALPIDDGLPVKTLRSECPSCGNAWPDENTHGDCPPGYSRSDHRHLKCRECHQEWVEALALPA